MHPVLLRLPLPGGQFELHSFGVLVAAGCALAIVVALREARRRGDDPERVRDLCFGALVAGLVGAPLAYVATRSVGWAASSPAAASARSPARRSGSASPTGAWLSRTCSRAASSLRARPGLSRSTPPSCTKPPVSSRCSCSSSASPAHPGRAL